MRDGRNMGGRLQRGVIIVPSTLTLGNLFFGFWAVISAARAEFHTAAWLIVIAGVLDLIDGRVARVTRTGSRFGAELDSLVDAISFGVAPALVIYYLFLTDGSWGWIASFVYVTGAVGRLARFNIEQVGPAKRSFHGLPSPAAGMTLATFFPFSQTAFFQETLAHWPWPAMVTALMVILAVLMMSHIPYPVVPKFGFRTARGILTLLGMIGMVIAAITVPALSFFPLLLLYVSYGVGRAMVLGFFERLPDRDPLLDNEESDDADDADDADAELREIDYQELIPSRRLWRPRRRRRTTRPPEENE
jgi:CDP-diacylglycerol--serine O-phosphatidyltransferase